MNTDYRVRYDQGSYYYEHRRIAESVLGRPLASNEEIHHVDGNPKNNVHSNLVICDRAYHKLLERRTRALNECGNANWRKCVYCKTWDDPNNLYIKPNDWEARHRACHADAERNRRNN